MLACGYKHFFFYMKNPKQKTIHGQQLVNSPDRQNHASDPEKLNIQAHEQSEESKATPLSLSP